MTGIDGDVPLKLINIVGELDDDQVDREEINDSKNISSNTLVVMQDDDDQMSQLPLQPQPQPQQIQLKQRPETTVPKPAQTARSRRSSRGHHLIPVGDPPITIRPDGILPDILDFIATSASSESPSSASSTFCSQTHRTTATSSECHHNYQHSLSQNHPSSYNTIRTGFTNTTLSNPRKGSLAYTFQTNKSHTTSHISTDVSSSTSSYHSPPHGAGLREGETDEHGRRYSAMTSRRVRTQQAKEMKLPYCVTSHRKFFGGVHFSPEQFNAWYRRDGFQRPVHGKDGMHFMAVVQFLQFSVSPLLSISQLL
jgi:hypothetical protein